MSQKEKRFQPKQRSGGQKFGGKGRGASFSEKRDYGRPGRGGFRKKFEGDRSDRPARSFGRDFGDKPYKKREFGGEGRRDFKPREDRHGGYGDKPYKKKDFGGKKPYNKDKGFNRPQKGYRNYDDRPAQRGFGAERGLASADARLKLKSDRPSYGSPSSAYLYGLHAVSEALLNPKRIHQRLLCTQKGFESLAEAWSDAQAEGITLPEVITVEKEDIDRLLPRDAVHQDVLLDSQPLEETSLYELLLTIPDEAHVLVLDQVTDPHNVGAILRSAAAFGAKAVVMQKLHAPDITGTLAKAASGAVEHVPLVRETNLSRALEQLKQAGFFCIGLDEDGKQTLAQMRLGGKVALVLGAEGSGLRRLVAENCDALVRLPTQPPIGSLNVSNAAAVALYELVRTKG